MIDDSKASELGEKFLSKHGHPKLAEYMDTHDYCLDAVFDQLIKSHGKSHVLYLYQKLPRKLKEYVMCELSPVGEWLREALFDIDHDLGRDCMTNPKAVKQFKEFKRRCNRVIMQYLKGEHHVDTSN